MLKQWIMKICGVSFLYFVFFIGVLSEPVSAGPWNEDTTFANNLDSCSFDIPPMRDTLVCQNELVRLFQAGDRYTGQSGYAVAWYDSLNDQPLIPTNVYGEFRHTYSNSYYLTVTDLATGCIYRDTVHVEIDSLPIIVLPDTLVTCTGNEVTFDFADEAVRYYDELEWTDKYSATRIRGRYDINPTFIYYDDFMEGYSVADLFVTGKGACTRHESNHSMVVILGEFFDLGLRSTVSGCSGEDGVTIEFESPYRDNALDYYWIQDGQQIRSERMHRDGLERDSTYRYVDTLVAISLDGCKRVERVRITLYRRPFIYNAEYDTINLGDGITLEAVCDASPARNPKLQWFEIQTDGNPLKITEGVGSVNVTPTYTTTYIAMNIPAVMSSCNANDTVTVVVIDGTKTPSDSNRISGYISYNGFWHPSDKGITRPEVLATPDVTVYDADAGGGVGRDGEHMAVGNVKLDLYEYETHRWIDSTTSDLDGLFIFSRAVPVGRYYVIGSSPQKTVTVGASGVTSNDATWVQQYAVGARNHPENPLSMWWYGANVDMSSVPAATLGIGSDDVECIQKRAVGAIIHFRDVMTNKELDDWAYSNDTFDINADTLLHIRGVMRGDANRDYKDNPLNSQLTKGGMRRFDTYGNIGVENRERIIDYPILSVSEGDILAFQLFMPYDASKVEILGVSSPVAEANVVYNFINDELLFNWICPYPVEVHTGDTLAMLKLHLQHRSVSRIDRCFRLNPTGYEVTLSDLQIDPGWRIALPEVTFYDDEKYLESDSSDFNEAASSTIDGEIRFERQDGKSGLSEIVSVVPNPMQARAEITYSVYDEGIVNLKLYTVLGEEVRSVVNYERQSGTNHRDIVVSDLLTGIYVLRLEVLRNNVVETDVVKVVVQK